MTCLPFAFIDGVGAPEMLLIFVLVLVLFGGQKLPEFARGVGKTLRELKKAAAGVEDEFKRALEEDERKQAAAALPDPSHTAQASTPDQAGPHAGHEAGHDPHHGYYDHDHHHGGENQDGAHGQPAETSPAAGGDPAGPVAEKTDASATVPPAGGEVAGAKPEGVTPTPAAPAEPTPPTPPPAPDGQAPKAP